MDPKLCTVMLQLAPRPIPSSTFFRRPGILVKLLFSVSVYGIHAIMFYVAMDVLKVDKLSEKLSNWVSDRSRFTISEYVVRALITTLLGKSSTFPLSTPPSPTISHTSSLPHSHRSEERRVRKESR